MLSTVCVPPSWWHADTMPMYVNEYCLMVDTLMIPKRYFWKYLMLLSGIIVQGMDLSMHVSTPQEHLADHAGGPFEYCGSAQEDLLINPMGCANKSLRCTRARCCRQVL